MKGNRSLVKALHRLLHEESGQSTTEYILILSIVVMVVMKFRDKFVSSVGDVTDSLGSKIVDAVNQTP